nr:hypothetical protein [Hordeum vulgare subsp. vulgare]
MQDAVIPLRDPCGRSPNPYKQGWGNLDNLIGGSNDTMNLHTMAYGFEVTSNTRGNLHNLMGDPDACLELYTITIELRGTIKLLGCQGIHIKQFLGYQLPNGNKLLKLHFHVSSWRTQVDATNAMCNIRGI